MLIQEFLRMVDDKALQVFFLTMLGISLKAQRFDTCLAFGASLPFRLRAFITTDMDIPGWKNVHHLREYIINKCQDTVISGTKHII